jgi:hypothetical protein
MFSKALLLTILAAIALGDPQPNSQTVIAPPFNTAILSDLPTFPSSIASVLITAIPSSVLAKSDYACELATATPSWFTTLPGDVQSALSSYEFALQSWYEVHSSELGCYDWVADLLGGLPPPPADY